MISTEQIHAQKIQKLRELMNMIAGLDEDTRGSIEINLRLLLDRYEDMELFNEHMRIMRELFE
jgi:ABC-type molybdate transport system ATPase subunit